MKKITLSMLLALAAITVSAQDRPAPTWSAHLTTTESAKDLHRGTPMAIDAEGNTVVTGGFTQDFTFASTTFEPIATSAFIAKYDKAGTAKWAATLKGGATVTAVTADEEGNVIAAGVFADEVVILDAEGNEKATINGMVDVAAQSSAFIVKYDKDGHYLASTTVIPVQPREANETCWVETPFFSPSKLVVSNGRIYMAASCEGDNKIANDLTIESHYGTAFGFATMDVPVFAVVSLTNDFTSAKLEAQMAPTAIDAAYMFGAESVNFVVDGSKLHVAFVACGTDLTLKTATSSKQITHLLSEGDGLPLFERAYIVATINGGNIEAMQTYHSKIDDNLREAKFNTIGAMQLQGENLFLAGTFNETFPFDNAKAYNGACDIYLACLNVADLTKKWALTSGFNEGDVNKKAEVFTGMGVYNDEVQLAGWAENTGDHAVETVLNYIADTDVEPTTLKEKTGTDALFITSLAQNKTFTIVQADNRTMTNDDASIEGKYTYSFYNDADDTSVKPIQGSALTIRYDGKVVALNKAANIVLYNASGMIECEAKQATALSLATLPSGVYVVKAGDKTLKIVK